MKKVITLCCAALLLPSFVFGPLPVGEKPSQVVLEGEQGYRVNGGSWSSDELVGAVHVLFYVDPDESDLNNVDRLGLHREGHVILGHSIPHVEIPVAAGRDTARLVTVAALDLQLRRLGYDMADEFNQKLLAKMQGNDPAI